jgi:hypothetical protein
MRIDDAGGLRTDIGFAVVHSPGVTDAVSCGDGVGALGDWLEKKLRDEAWDIGHFSSCDLVRCIHRLHGFIVGDDTVRAKEIPAFDQHPDQVFIVFKSLPGGLEGCVERAGPLRQSHNIVGGKLAGDGSEVLKHSRFGLVADLSSQS